MLFVGALLYALLALSDGAINSALLPVQCKLQAERGPCLSTEPPMFYYDLSQQQCVPFNYGGCDGNDNRFASMEECMAVCTTAGSGAGTGSGGTGPQEPGAGDDTPVEDSTQPAPTTLQDVPVSTTPPAPAPAQCEQETKAGYQLVASFSYKTLSMADVVACTGACDKDQKCRSAHFFTFSKAGTFNCMLNSENDINYPDHLRQLPESLTDRVTYYRACK